MATSTYSFDLNSCAPDDSHVARGLERVSALVGPSRILAISLSQFQQPLTGLGVASSGRQSNTEKTDT